MEAGKLVTRFLRSFGLGSHSRQVVLEQRRCGATGPGGSRNSMEEFLECPVCWEGFNGAEHTPYVLFCGHTICRSCLMGLQWATWKLPSFHVQLPLLISCPWCQFLTLRFYWRGSRIKFPCKNYFLLSVVESVRGHSATHKEEELSLEREQDSVATSRLDKVRRLSELWRVGFSLEQRRDWTILVDGFFQGDWSSDQMFRLLSLIIQVIAKLPLVALFLFIVLYVLPVSALLLVVYCLVTLLLAIPAYLVIYFSFPGLQWLAREIAAA